MKRYLPFILIVLMVILIIGSSLLDGPTSYGSSEKIASCIIKVLRFFGDMEYSVTTVDIIFRKIAHFMEYLLLTVLLSIGFSNAVKKQWWSFLISSITSGFIALMDEAFIQTISGRNSSLFDIIIDFTGIIAGLTVFALMLCLNVKQKGKWIH